MVLYPPHLRRTVTITLVVGTVLFCINQLDIVVRGDATALVWVKTAITYVVRLRVERRRTRGQPTGGARQATGRRQRHLA